MARDAELDRLKAAKDLAFQRQQNAWEAQNQAWERRKAAGDVLSRAYDAKQAAYAAQDASWQHLQQTRDRNNPRIDQLFKQQESAYERQQNAFNNASIAHTNRDGASARRYADEGHAAKTECQQYVAERRRLVDENRAAQARHEQTKPAFQQAKAQFDQAKRNFDTAKADHERKLAEFKRAKADAESTKKTFMSRLEKVKADGKRKHDDKRDIARRAGVPSQYLDNVWISTDADGNTNIYFGGVGEPNGHGHGHYVVDRRGTVTYRRDPFDPHGAENFEEAKDAALLYIRSARSNHEPLGTNEHGGVFYRRSDAGGTELHITQFFADKYRVSWNATPYGNREVHWTKVDLPYGHPDRHIPPPDATLR